MYSPPAQPAPLEKRPGLIDERSLTMRFDGQYGRAWYRDGHLRVTVVPMGLTHAMTVATMKARTEAYLAVIKSIHSNIASPVGFLVNVGTNRVDVVNRVDAGQVAGVLVCPSPL